MKEMTRDEYLAQIEEGHYRHTQMNYETRVNHVKDRIQSLKTNFIRCITQSHWLQLDYRDLDNQLNVYKKHSSLTGMKTDLVEVIDGLLFEFIEMSNKKNRKEIIDSLISLTELGITEDCYGSSFIDTLKFMYPEIESIDNYDDFTEVFAGIVLKDFENSNIKLYLMNELIESVGGLQRK